MTEIRKTSYTEKAHQEYAKKTDSAIADKLHKKYEKQQQDLANQIIDPPRTIEDLKHNAKIKQQQISLATSIGGDKRITEWQQELSNILSDIQNKESSVFDQN